MLCRKVGRVFDGALMKVGLVPFLPAGIRRLIELQDGLAGKVLGRDVDRVNQRPGFAAAQLAAQVDLTIDLPLPTEDWKEIPVGLWPTQAVIA
ncbi:MAG: hypothetical protein AAF495_05440 [Pseudomonadota bacterium]